MFLVRWDFSVNSYTFSLETDHVTETAFSVGRVSRLGTKGAWFKQIKGVGNRKLCALLPVWLVDKKGNTKPWLNKMGLE